MSIYTNKIKIKPVTTPEYKYWDKTETDYNKTQNLILGLPQFIESGDEERVNIQELNSPADSTTLADGIIPITVSYDRKDWFKCCHGLYRDIVFDLQKTSCVTGFKGVFLYSYEAAVYLPRNFVVYISENGEDWETVYKNNALTAKLPQEIFTLEESFEYKHKARFVKFSFDVDIWVMIGELEVIGTKAIPDTALDVKPIKEAKRKEINLDKYLMPEDFFGINDLMLAYNCHPGRSDKGKLTVEQLLPYVAYYDKQGEMKDTFFDAFLFLPFAAFPMRKPETTQALWHDYVNNTFAKGYNTDALDFATGEAKSKLNKPEFKTKVFLSILYPFKTQKNFGDLYGNGDNLDFSVYDDRIKAIKWLINTQLGLFKERNYQNTELCGFYWFEEQILATDEGEKEMIKWTTDYVRSLGFKTIWIPYFRASGYNSWRDYGIDFACMQPNYSFTKETEEVLYSNAKITKQYGMCVEMEIGGTSDEKIDKYNAYMRVGVEKGYMNSVHMYYQDGGPGVFYQAFISKNKKLNDVYHNTYKFAKHTLKQDFVK